MSDIDIICKSAPLTAAHATGRKSIMTFSHEYFNVLTFCGDQSNIENITPETY